MNINQQVGQYNLETQFEPLPTAATMWPPIRSLGGFAVDYTRHFSRTVPQLTFDRDAAQEAVDSYGYEVEAYSGALLLSRVNATPIKSGYNITGTSALDLGTPTNKAWFDDVIQVEKPAIIVPIDPSRLTLDPAEAVIELNRRTLRGLYHALLLRSYKELTNIAGQAPKDYHKFDPRKLFSDRPMATHAQQKAYIESQVAKIAISDSNRQDSRELPAMFTLAKTD